MSKLLQEFSTGQRVAALLSRRPAQQAQHSAAMSQVELLAEYFASLQRSAAVGVGFRPVKPTANGVRDDWQTSSTLQALLGSGEHRVGGWVGGLFCSAVCAGSLRQHKTAGLRQHAECGPAACQAQHGNPSYCVHTRQRGWVLQYQAQ